MNSFSLIPIDSQTIREDPHRKQMQGNVRHIFQFKEICTSIEDMNVIRTHRTYNVF